MNETYLVDDWSRSGCDNFFRLDKMKRAVESEIGYALADDITKLNVLLYKTMLGIMEKRDEKNENHN